VSELEVANCDLKIVSDGVATVWDLDIANCDIKIVSAVQADSYENPHPSGRDFRIRLGQ
jgi:hypothetical protein